MIKRVISADNVMETGLVRQLLVGRELQQLELCGTLLQMWGNKDSDDVNNFASFLSGSFPEFPFTPISSSVFSSTWSTFFTL